MAIIRINPIKDSRWLEFINKFPRSNIFHHPSWLKLLSIQYKFDTFAICSIDADETIKAALPLCEIKGINGRKWISLPFTDYVEPLFDSEENMDEIIDHLITNQTEKKVDSIEIRYRNDAFFNFSNEFYHILELENKNEQEIFNSLKDSHKRNIKKSKKEGLTGEILYSKESVNEFYLLHLKTRKKQGVPIQPKSFFNNMYEELIKNGLGFVVLVKKENKALATGLFLGFNRTLTYKYGASDPDELLLRPNNLMFMTAIEYAIKKGYQYFDFGKTENENVGLREFKSGWGAVEYPLYYSFYPSIPGKGIFSFIKDKIMKPVIKLSPSFVCRLTGELFYKHSV
jgi:hypothetical protein